MYSAILPTLLSLASLAAASQSNNNCIDLTVPVKVSATIHPLKITPFKNGYEATEFLLQTSKRDAPADPSALVDSPKNITKSYNISTRYCAPTSKQSSQTVQVLTHGLGFDKSYWHFQLGNDTQYNYAVAANKAGYATLSYDRLGNGASTIVDPYNEQQAAVELAVLVELTNMLRAGKISDKIPVPKKVVHVGHSYGAFLSNGVAANAPEVTDGVVLSGFSHNQTWTSWFTIATSYHLASENQPKRFANLSSGHITWADKYANQYGFLKYPSFDPAVLEKAEATKFPFSVGEFFAQQYVSLAAPTFAKPVMLMAAENDLIFCGADCNGIVDGPTSNTPEVFPAAKPLEIYIQPNTGHGMNLHYNATGWYDVVFKFLGTNGL